MGVLMNDNDIVHIKLDDPEIVILERPRIYQSDLGDMDEDNAALYISYRMRREVKPRTLRDWRMNGIGPPYATGPSGRPIWYRETDLDRWIERKLVKDPATGEPLAA